MAGRGAGPRARAGARPGDGRRCVAVGCGRGARPELCARAQRHQEWNAAGAGCTPLTGQRTGSGARMHCPGAMQPRRAAASACACPFKALPGTAAPVRRAAGPTAARTPPWRATVTGAAAARAGITGAWLRAQQLAAVPREAMTLAMGAGVFAEIRSSVDHTPVTTVDGDLPGLQRLGMQPKAPCRGPGHLALRSNAEPAVHLAVRGACVRSSERGRAGSNKHAKQRVAGRPIHPHVSQNLHLQQAAAERSTMAEGATVKVQELRPGASGLTLTVKVCPTLRDSRSCRMQPGPPAPLLS